MSSIITSKDNPTVKLAKALLTQARQRKKLAKTVLEGTHLIDSAIRANFGLDVVIIGENAQKNLEIQQLLSQLQQYYPKTPIITISDSLYKDIRSLGESLPIMAIISLPTLNFPTTIHTDCLIINGIQDNGNLGTLLRTSACVGINNIICTIGTASAWSPKTLRASMGANFSLNIYENVAIDTVLQCVKVTKFATSSHTDTIIYQQDLTKPLALIMGHEGQGVDAKLMSQAHPITLPQPNGQESLNVAIAGSLCLYEILRQRHYSV